MPVYGSEIAEGVWLGLFRRSESFQMSGKEHALSGRATEIMQAVYPSLMDYKNDWIASL
jgi:hypothetical protein